MCLKSPLLQKGDSLFSPWGNCHRLVEPVSLLFVHVRNFISNHSSICVVLMIFTYSYEKFILGIPVILHNKTELDRILLNLSKVLNGKLEVAICFDWLGRGYARGDRKFLVIFQNTFYLKQCLWGKNMYHRIHMEAKGHLAEMSSLLLPHASRV